MQIISSLTDKRSFFLSMVTPNDVAALLEVPYSRLVYHIYKVPIDQKYAIFTIKKKGVGVREITAPISALKLIQRKLSKVLYQVYEPKATVHGFTIGKNVVTNSSPHRLKRHVLNIDLEDFFPSINFARVRGMFMAVPYELPPSVATVLSQICCFNDGERDFLPQGAPTSPIISNMLCARMDSELRELAKVNSCTYTRYVDDITFSTTLRIFPKGIGKIVGSKKSQDGFRLSSSLSETFKSNHFQINRRKVRLQSSFRRQEVTGLTVNKFPNVKRTYVRRIRAMLNAWRKHGIDKAQERLVEKYNNKPRNPVKKIVDFRDVLRGRIEFLGMVRGRENLIYLKYLNQFMELMGKPIIPLPTIEYKHEKLGRTVEFLQSRYDKIEEELDIATEPESFEFIIEEFQNIVNILRILNRRMKRAQKKDDFVDFCSFAFLQLEEGIKRLIKSPRLPDFEATASCHPRIKVRSFLPATDMVWLLQLCTEHYKVELLRSGFLEEGKEYMHHNFEDPYSNKYQILQYTRIIRNFSSHREGDGNTEIVKRLNIKVEELRKRYEEVDEASHEKHGLWYNIQSHEQAIQFYMIKNYDSLENCLLEYLKTVLS